MKALSVEDTNAVLKAIPDVTNWVISGARKATKFISPTLTVKASRIHKLDRRSRAESYVVSVGKPNYKEREFIKACKDAGETFPVKRIQLKFYPDAR